MLSQLTCRRQVAALLSLTIGCVLTLASASATGVPVHAPESSAAKPFTLGLSYVAPPHLPGAKVRTPEGLAPVLAERLGKTLRLQPVPVEPGAVAVVAGVSAGEQPDAMLLPLSPTEAGQAAGQVIPTGYRAGIMAIMRTDTDIHQWDDLRGRTVCLAEGSGLTGQLQSNYGAVEKVFRAPADALLDLRIGGCDATVHDSTLLEALLQFPEWQKFSARLPVQQERDLAFVVPAHTPALAETLRLQAQRWQQGDLLARLTQQAARDIAFEVYMDQEVPDCH